MQVKFYMENKIKQVKMIKVKLMSAKKNAVQNYSA